MKCMKEIMRDNKNLNKPISPTAEDLDNILSRHKLSFFEDIKSYNANLIKSIEIRRKMLTEPPTDNMCPAIRKTAIDASLEILIFEQKHLQRIINRHTI